MMKKYKSILSVAAMAAMVFFSFAGAQAQTSHVTIGGSVFGGGNLAAVSGSTTVLLDQENAVVTGDVYGGGALANVGTSNSDTTKVTLLQGAVNGDVYGGGLGRVAVADDESTPDVDESVSAIAALVNGVVTINIGSGTVDGSTGFATSTSGAATIGGSVFGCNNVNGTPKDNVFVNIYQTAHDEDNIYPSPEPTEEAMVTPAASTAFAIKNVYGGGNKAAYAPVDNTKAVLVHIYSCANTIQTVYGGGNAADATKVGLTIDGGRFDRLFGGGNGYSATGNHNDPTAENYNPGANISVSATTQIHGGLYRQVFGGSNQYGDVASASLSIDKSSPCSEIIAEAFGGANEADITGNIETTLECSASNVHIGNFYGGSNLASISGNVTLNVIGGSYTHVYGGSKGRAAVAADPEHGIEAVAAKAANIGGNVTLNLYGGTITTAFGGSNIYGNIEGNIIVNVEDTSTRCPLSVDTVYGAGNLTAYTPNTPGAYPEVNIKNGTIGGNVYGGGFGPSAIVTSNPVVTIGDVTVGHEGYVATVEGSIYGSGYAASVTGNTTVVMTKANSSASKLFGGGANAGVTGNTSVTLTNGTVLDGIFGGSDTTGTITGNTVIALNGGYAGTNVHPANYGICGGGWGLDTRVGGNVTLTLNGTSVNGELYGGSYYGDVNTTSSNTTTVTLTSGSVTGNVYGGGFGDSESGAYALVNGAVTVNANGATVNGNIFGCNNDNGAPQSTVAVSFTGGSAYGVFGGGNLASYGGTPVITVSGGTITKRVVGGGYAAGVGGSSITISNGAIATEIDQPGCGVFGGCFTSGEVDGDIIVSVTGGTIGTDATHRANIHGGGYGDETSSTGDVTVTFGNSNVSHQNSPVLYGDLYGGSGFGNVNESTSNTTTVNVLNGEITGDVYGGGLGQKYVAGEGTPGDPGYVEEIPAYPALVNGDVVVNIGASPSTGKVKFNTYDGGDKGGRVFGANNANGTPKGNVSVNIYATDHGSGIANNEYPLPYGTIRTASDLETNAATQTYAIAAVFGGGNEASYTPVADKSATVHVYNCDNTIKDVYGGGNAADVGTTGEGAIPANTYVVIDGGRIHRVFGGGNGEVTPANTYGTATTTVNAGLIDQIFGCGNMQGSITATDLQLRKTGSCTDEVWGEIFGGANLAAITSDLSTTIDCGVGTIGDIYGGSNKASITGNVALTVKGGIYTNVYGGSKGIRGNGSTILDTAANITGNVTLNLHGGTLTNAFGGSNINGNITGSITVNVEDAETENCELDVTNIYGAGNLTAYTPADNTISYPQVNIKHIKSGNSIHGNVFGGGKQASVTANPVVNIGNGSNGQLATISGNVFGGGDEAGVNGATTVNMISGSVATGLYGGCNTSGTVSGNITVALTGGTVGTNGTTTDVVYGGGYGHSTATGGDVSVTLGGATVYGNLYGGSALGSVGGSTSNATTVTIGGGGLHGTVFGGGMGSGSEASTQATTLGNVIVNYNTANTALTGIYGGANVNGDVAGDIAVNIEANVGATGVGNSRDIFGGGLGQHTTTGGDVTVTVGNSTTPTIYGDIYGGSGFGEVSASSKLTKVDFKNGTLNGTIYGGGMGQVTPAISAIVSGDIEVAVANGTITTGVYGGCNERGNVVGDITVGMTGGTVGANGSPASIFGGGYGANTTTQGDVEVNINGASAVVWGDVYGGSGLGDVNSDGSDATTVNILNGEVKRDVFGGGLGSPSAAAQVAGVVTVNIGQNNGGGSYSGNATIGGNVYGCNNTNGSPQQEVTVNIYGTAHTAGVNTLADDGYAIANVFGGGKNADYTIAGKVATVNVFGCNNTIGRVFGGGDAAAVTGTSVDLQGGRFNYVFGGGNGEVTAADVGTSGIDLAIHGGTIGTLVSGSNTQGTISGPINVNVDNNSGCDEEVTDFFGGSNAVDITTDVTTTIECGAGVFHNVYGGSNAANITGNVVLNLKGGTMENVYGGSKGTNSVAANITGNVTLNLYGGTVSQDAFGGSNVNGNITGNITINVLDHEGTCALDVNNIYGGGNLTPYTPTNASATTPTINVMHINQAEGIRGNVYGGGKGATAIVTAQPRVNIGYNATTMNALATVEYPAGIDRNTQYVAKVAGSVFGGGDAAAVTGNPVVKIQTANTSVANVYGGGNAAGITGNTDVTVAGGRVATGIYGGCNTAGDVTGNSTVTLNGGTIGRRIAPEGLANGYVTGRIFGGGYGASTNVDGNIHVTLNGATVYGDLYGGSALGHVNTNSTHLVGGTVNNTDSVLVDILDGYIQGDIYGGGLGDKAALGEGHTDVAAMVHGKVHVNVGDSTHTTSPITGNDTVIFTGNAQLRTYPVTSMTLGGGSVYGCNNTNGSPQNKVYVDVWKTYMRPNDHPDTMSQYRTYAIENVFGGGNAADYRPNGGSTTDTAYRPFVYIHGCGNTVKEVFGGGNAAYALGTNVTVEGGRFNEIFGGGNGAVIAANIGEGGVDLKAKSGHVGYIFGACNRQGTVIGNDGNIRITQGGGACGNLIVDYHFFGGNFADIIGDYTFKMECTDVKSFLSVYGGCRLGTVYGNITLIIEGGNFGSVFGGSLGANDYAANIKKYPTKAELDADPGHTTFSDEIHTYMASHMEKAGTGGNVNVIIKGGYVGSVFGGCDQNGSVQGNVTVVIDSSTSCPLVLNYVYGGGNLAQYNPDVTNAIDPANTTNPIIELRNGTVNKDVFAGGHGSLDNVDAGLVTTNPLLVMGGSQKIDTAYLRSNNEVRWIAIDPVEDANDKFWVKGNIYGGGEMASVGNFTRSSNAVTACAANTGKTTVEIRTGTVGPASMPADFLSGYSGDNLQNDRIVGMVFGGSKGVIGDTTVNPLYSHIAYANQTEVIIGNSDHTGPFIKGSVYGGSQNGRVYTGGTYVKVQGGQIGCGAGHTAVYAEGKFIATPVNPDVAASDTLAECPHWEFGRQDAGDSEKQYLPYDPYATNSSASTEARLKGSDGHTFYGNVFGGGSGYFPYDNGKWLRSAGRVFGSTKVEITGGHILTNIYGGNELTDVTGDSCVVIMTGGTLGVPRSLAQIARCPVTCYLFGAGKGDQRTLFNTWTNVQDVRVSIGGDARIYGSVFGGGEDGHVMRNVKIDFKDVVLGTTGTSYVDGNIFGAGRGFSGDALTAGNVGGDVAIDISGDNTTKVLGSVYGGGRLASVGYGLYSPSDPHYGIVRPDNQDDDGNPVANFSRGHVTVNIHGYATIGNEVPSECAMEHTRGGNVFGASMGRLKKLNDTYLLDLWKNLGRVKQTTVNIYDHAQVRSNVYGGSELGSVADSTEVNIYGNAVIGHLYGDEHHHGEVYGGGYGISTKKFDLTSITEEGDLRNKVQSFAGRVYGSTAVNIRGDVILHGDVYGGGEMASVGTEDSLNRGNTLVNIGQDNAGSYIGNATIFGGDIYGCNNIAGTPLGNAAVNIYSTHRESNEEADYSGDSPAFALANVFGGGNEADYRPNGDPSGSTKMTSVHVYGCDNTIEDLFSGGNAAYAYGVTTIIDGGRFDRVFGGGNGEVTTADIGLGGTNTTINAGMIHQLFGGSNMRGVLGGPVQTLLTHKGDCPENIGEFYAGSNEAPIVGDITTIVECTTDPEKLVNVDEFYGGCNLTTVYGNVTLIVNGGRFGRLFGGSKGSNSIAADIKRYDDTHYPTGREDLKGTGGNVNLYIYGGTIGRAFGGSDVNGNIEGAINVYVNDTSTNCPLNLDYVYGGGDLATNAVVDATITSPYVHLLNGTVNQNVYGGGRGTLDNIEKGRTTANAKVEMNPTGDQHFWVKGNIYGGGELAYVGGNDTVIINGGKVGPYAPAVGTTRYTLKGCVYGGGLGKPGSTYANFARVGGNTVVSIGANTDTIHGSVFGGGEDGQVLGNTSVTVAGGVIGVPTKYTGDLSELNTYVGNVYGGGRGIDLDASGYLTATAGMVGGNTAVTISGGHVCRSVYGGGSIASVGRDGGVGFKPFDNTKGGTSVTVTGGLIGVYAAPTDNGANANPRYTVNPNATYGSVYGGGRGLPGTSLDGKNNYTNMAYVNNTAVTINYSSVDDSPSGTNHIVGNVFGGADNGSVNNSTSVTITGGRIGSDGNKDFGSLDGNVFGGGRGEGTYRTYRPDTSTEIDTISPSAGGTYGNTSVLINGETRNSVQVMHHVYGGGANASVGDYDRAAAAVGSGLDETLAKGEVYLLTNANRPSTHPAATDTAGTCKVTVTGGTIGTSGRNNGMIFGASRGDIGAPGSIYDSIAYVNKTIVTIGGGTNSSTNLNDFNPLITGSIYGGGENGHTVADAYVYIHDGRVGNHGDMYDRTKTLEDSIETLQKWVKEHSEDAHKDDTLARIEAFTTEMNSNLDFLSLCGNIYGGGCGTDKYIDINDGNKEKYNSFAGVVFGNATILMDGGYVEHNIYGGGAMANLGRRVGAYIEHTNDTFSFALSWPAEIHCRKNTGVARITVSGAARLGYSGKDNGDIFGASRGEAGLPISMTKFANVDSTVVLVNITDHAGKSDAQYYGDPTTGQLGVNPKNDHTTPLVAGSVYGGAENGHVIRSTNVQLQAGIVGHSIYGGGKGKGKYLATNLKAHDDSDSSAMIYSLTAGRVYNNTYVTMTGGRVIRSIYGGGNMASVGKGNYAGGPGAWQGRGYGENWVDSNKTKLTGILAKTGHTLVYITGGTVGILNPSKPKESFKDDLPLGNVFGGCRGEAAPRSSKRPRHLYSPGYFSGYTNHTRVIIGDSTSPVATPTSTSPRIYGSVYGGGQDGHVRNKTVVIINDAEIGVPYVSPSRASTLVGVNDISDMHWLGRGNVFGAGSGIGQYDSDGDGEADTYNDASGSVTDSTLIVINGGLIHQNVYGGGALASIGPMILPFDTDKTPDSTWSMARVFVKGGTIGTAGDCSGMYIFGTDTTVFGNYGGNVYGAGHGFAGDTYKNFNNTHHTHIHASGGTINGDVYGGAEDGHVISNTWVDINGTVTIGYNGLDNFNGNIFGGGRGSGSFATPGDASTYTMNVTCGRVGGNTNLTVDGNAVILGSLFGGGRTALTGINADGELDATFFTEGNYDSVNHGYAYVTVKGSPKIGNSDGAALEASDYSVGDIFGSGKGDIECYNDVRAGRVMNASVHISQTPRIYGAIYGGGEMAGVGWWDNTNLYTPLACGFAPKTGTTKVTLTGCDTIGTKLEYTQAYLENHGAWTVIVDGKLTHACTGTIVGASQGDVDPESPHWISMGRSRQSYVDISGTGTIMGNVYGGAEQGVVLENTDVRVSGCTIGTRIVNPDADINKAKYISDSTEWKRDSATLVSNWINNDSANWVTAHATWETEHDAWETAHDEWEQDPTQGDEPIEPIEPIKPTRPTAPVPVDTNNYLYYFGSVFGGGYGREVTPRHINDSCLYTINGNDTTWTKLVEATQIAGRVYGNTNVLISGGTIRENVYGGGNMASVGYVREDANHKYNLIDSSYRQTNGVHTNGICTVRICNDTTGTGVDRVITGPIIGPNDHTQMNGHVYGGGKGVGNDPTEYFKNYCNVHETHLTVSGGHIYGSTFGGGADGHVLGHTHTTIQYGAYIGSGEDTQEYDGCVWGGGRNALNINHTAGRVQGHTFVTVTGGRIRRTVQGGGALARTGVDTNGVVECFLTGGTAANGAPIYDSTHHGNTNIYVTAGAPDVRDAVLKNGKDYDGRAVLAADMTTDEKKERNKNFIYFFADDADSTTYKDYLGTTEARKVGNDYKIVVYKTAIGAYDGPVLVDNDYTIGDIFGGGKGDTKDTVDILAGRVMNTYVRVDGYPRIMADIYAGGEMSSVGWWDTNLYQFKDDGTYEYSPSRPKNPLHNKYYGGTGYTHLVIDGEPYTGTPYEFSSSCIHYGRPWTLVDSLGRLYHTCSGNVYGGGQGYVEQDGTHYWNWVHMGRVRNTSVEVNGGRFMGNCFGGGARGVVKEDCHVTVTGGCFGSIIYDQPEGFPKDHYYYGSVFGGGYGNHKRFSHISDSSFILKNGTILEMVPTEQAGRVYGNTIVKITGGQIMDCVYGGGDMASTGWVERDSTTGDFIYTEPGKRHGGVCNVDISGSTIVGPLDYNGHNAYVYAAGRGIGHDSIEYSKTFCNVNEAHLTVHLTTTGDPSTKPGDWNPSTHGGRIWGSLFGGGADSHVLDSVSVVVHSGIVGTQGTTSFDGNIFGGGRNYLNTNHTNGRVQGNIRVLMDGGTIQGTIFGGGRMALSGVDVDGHYIDSTYGNVNILVCGNATIGNSNADSLLFADESCGDIFGSGKGDIKNYEDIWAGRVTNAKITVKDSLGHSPRIYGSIFGGGEMASLGYWDDTIKDAEGNVIFHTKDDVSGSYGTAYGVMYENTGRAVINLSGNLTLGTAKEYTVDPDDNPGDWTIYNEDKDTLLHTCTGNVFGGGQGDVDPSSPRWVSMGRSASAVVNISGGTYYGNIFGGSEQGIVTGDTRLNISGGNFGYTNQEGSINNQLRKVYSGDIYAAGYGCDDPADNAIPYVYDDDTIANPINDSTAGSIALGIGWTPDVLAGRTFGNARVDITGGTIHGSVYGGGSFASVGDDKPGFTVNGNTTVNIGLPGPSAAKAAPDTVIGNATIDGEVFGANNFSGTPYGNTTVHIYKTAHDGTNNAPTADDAKALSDPADELTEADVEALPTDAENFALSAVYGGGNRAAHTPIASSSTTLVHVHYCEENTIRTVYGGGNAASTENNHIIIDGGRIYEIYGGGNGAGEGNPGADVHGTAHTEIHGGLITELFGGSNSKGVVGNIALDIEPSGTCDIMVANTYGGSNEAEGGGGVVNLLCGTKIGSFYGGSRKADLVGDITLNVYGGTYENIFGGSQGTPSEPANIEGNVTLNFYGGNVQHLFGGSDVNGNISGTVLVNVDIDPDYSCPDGLRLDNVYGAGRDAAYTPYDPYRGSPTVNVMNNRYKPAGGSDSAWVEIQDVFGGGLGATATTTSYPRVVIGGFEDGSKTVNETPVTYHRAARIFGNAYGGGSMAPVKGNTYVLVRDAVIGRDDEVESFTSGNLFGGGYGSTSKVMGDTYVGVFGLSDIKSNVYGGGNAGIVTGNTEVVVGYQKQVIVPELIAYADTINKGQPNQQVKIMAGLHSATPGVRFYYTKDGTTPTTTNGTLYTDDILSEGHNKANDFEIDWDDEIQMIAYLWDEVHDEIDSTMIPSIVGFDRSTSPLITIKDGKATFDGTVGARVYYTLDGSQPDTSSALWATIGEGESEGSPVTIGSTDVVKALSVQRGCINSEVSFLVADAPTVDNGDNTTTFTITAQPGERIIYTVGTTDIPTPISLMNRGRRPGQGPGETGMTESTDDTPGHTATASDGSTVTHKKRVYTNSHGETVTYRWSEVTAASSGNTTVTITFDNATVDHTVKAICERAGHVPSPIAAAVYEH